MYRLSSFAGLCAVLLLTSCDKASDKAKREYRMMLKSEASVEDQCRKMQEIAAAYLAEENETKYPMAKIEADMKCNQMALQRLEYP